MMAVVDLLGSSLHRMHAQASVAETLHFLKQAKQKDLSKKCFCQPSNSDRYIRRDLMLFGRFVQQSPLTPSDNFIKWKCPKKSGYLSSTSAPFATLVREHPLLHWVTVQDKRYLSTVNSLRTKPDTTH